MINSRHTYSFSNKSVYHYKKFFPREKNREFLNFKIYYLEIIKL